MSSQEALPSSAHGQCPFQPIFLSRGLVLSTYPAQSWERMLDYDVVQTELLSSPAVSGMWALEAAVHPPRVKSPSELTGTRVGRDSHPALCPGSLLYFSGGCVCPSHPVLSCHLTACPEPDPVRYPPLPAPASPPGAREEAPVPPACPGCLCSHGRSGPAGSGKWNPFTEENEGSQESESYMCVCVFQESESNRGVCVCAHNVPRELE